MKKRLTIFGLIFVISCLSCSQNFDLSENDTPSVFENILAESSSFFQSSNSQDAFEGSVILSSSSNVSSNDSYQSTQENNIFLNEIKTKTANIRKDLSMTDDYGVYCFYTDPHFYYSTGDYTFDQTFIERYLSILKDASLLTSSQFVLCGGDLLCNNDTRDQAQFKLKNFVDLTKNTFEDDCFLIVGNHDTNYQGNTFINSGNYNDCILPQDTINQILFNGKKSYYSFKKSTTTYYCFDSGIDLFLYDVLDYQYEQIDWFCRCLLEERNDHSVIFIHIPLVNSNDSLTAMMKEIGKVIEAYNDRGTVLIKDFLFDYSSAHGKIEYIQAGHVHKDLDTFYCGGVPVIVTDAFSNYTDDGIPLFDIVLSDYSNSKVICYRVGKGLNRIINI